MSDPPGRFVRDAYDTVPRDDDDLDDDMDDAALYAEAAASVVGVGSDLDMQEREGLLGDGAGGRGTRIPPTSSCHDISRPRGAGEVF